MIFSERDRTRLADLDKDAIELKQRLGSRTDKLSLHEVINREFKALNERLDGAGSDSLRFRQLLIERLNVMQKDFDGECLAAGQSQVTIADNVVKVLHAAVTAEAETTREKIFGANEVTAETFSRVAGALERTVTGLVSGLKAEMLNQFAAIGKRPSIEETVQQNAEVLRAALLAEDVGAVPKVVCPIVKDMEFIAKEMRELRAAVVLLGQQVQAQQEFPNGLLARLQTYERLASTLGGRKARKRKGKRK